MAETAQRWMLAVVLTVGVALRGRAAVTVPAEPDAYNYADLAGRLRWVDPWQSSVREPLWELLVKVTTGPFGYRVGALQALSCALGIIGLGVAVWAIRSVSSGWVAVAGVAVLAGAPNLVTTSAQGTRESVGMLIVALAVVLVVHAPGWLPVLGAVTLGVRWEMGVGLLVACAALTVGRVVPARRLLVAATVAVVVVGPFLANNAQRVGDPLLHSDIHATFYANLERVGFEPQPVLPIEDRIVPEITPGLYRGPLVGWGDYAAQIGWGEAARRESVAVLELPMAGLRFGVLPVVVSAVLFGLAVVGAVRRRDRLVALIGVLTVVTVGGYGLVLPWLNMRLVAHLSVLLVVLICAGHGRADIAAR